MTNLSKRLKAIASYVKSDTSFVVDVGCDHALLDIYLKKLYPHLKIIATDNKRGAINHALFNVRKSHLTGMIDIRLGDGLSNIVKSEIDTIILAGMGTSTIIKILTKDINKLAQAKYLIIQSTNNYFYLRKKICSLGYYIAHEQMVKEDNKSYLVICFQKGHRHYNNYDYYMGPILRHNKDVLRDELGKKEILLSQIPHKCFFRRLKTIINMLYLRYQIK